MALSYREFDEMDGLWIDAIALISKIVQQYEESRQHLQSHGATLGNPTGTTIKG